MEVKLMEITADDGKLYQAVVFRDTDTPGGDAQEVYDQGYAAGHADGYEEGQTTGYTDGYAAGQTTGYTNGCSAENERFWNVLQNNGARNNYAYAFNGWGCEEIVPLHKIAPNSGTMAMVFASNQSLKVVREEHFDFSNVPVATSAITGNYGTFMACSNLELVEDIGLQPNFSYDYTFANCTKLKKIAMMRVNENTTFNNTFAGCYALEDLTISGTIGQNGFQVTHSPLSRDSVLGIVSALADKSADTSKTWVIKLGTNNLGKLSVAEKEEITNKGWRAE